jgi:hypothetical protein
MRLRFFAALTLVAVALLAAPAGAQTANATDAAETAANATAEETAIGQLSPVVTILEYSYNDGEMSITIRAKVPRLITVQDATVEIASEGFSRQPDARRVNLARGKNQITVSVTPSDGNAVVEVTDPRAGTGGYLSTGVGGAQLLHERNPAAAWFGGLFVGTGAVVGGGLIGLWRLGGEPRRATR